MSKEYSILAIINKKNVSKPSKKENIIGWIATIDVLAAYALNALGYIESDHLFYILSNLIGGMGVMYIAFRYKNYQSALINLFWLIIAGIALASR